jgi:hypothetical protein
MGRLFFAKIGKNNEKEVKRGKLGKQGKGGKPLSIPTSPCPLQRGNLGDREGTPLRNDAVHGHKKSV